MQRRSNQRSSPKRGKNHKRALRDGLFSAARPKSLSDRYALPARGATTKVLASGYASLAAARQDPLRGTRSPRHGGASSPGGGLTSPKAGPASPKAGGLGLVSSATLEPTTGLSGMDGISFFAQHSEGHPVKFMKFNRAPPQRGRFRPYDLVSVADADLNRADHFTMSAEGVVHVQAGQPSEFIPLAEWMRHSTLYNVVSSIRFFRMFLAAKAFRAWRQAVRFRLFCAQRARLESRLFLAMPTFCGPLLRVNDLLSEVSNVELVQVGGGPGDPRGARAASAADFEAQQAAVRAEGSKRLEAISDKAANVVKKVCQDAAAARKRFERGEGSHADLDAGVDRR